VTIATILLLAAFFCFVLATFNLSVFNLNLVALGLALWVLTLILGVFAGLGSEVVIILLVVLLIVLIIYVAVRIPRRPAG
jgi:hypothetical protein